jgi:hypothetical protein
MATLIQGWRAWSLIMVAGISGHHASDPWGSASLFAGLTADLRRAVIEDVRHELDPHDNNGPIDVDGALHARVAYESARG